VIEERLRFAEELALQAGDLLRRGLGAMLEVGHKGAVDLVTEYDVQSEQLMVEAIRRAYPRDSILAEEGGESGAGELQWLLDPLDGTTNYAHGLPIFSVSIALARDGEILLGVVYDPTRGELFAASAGGGAWLDGRRLRVSSHDRLNDSLLVTGFPYDIRTNPDNNLDRFAALSLLTRGVRRLGSAALDLAYVAAGRFDGYWEARLSPWDWAAGILLVREAGGTVSRIDGGQDLFREPSSILASNGLIHAELKEALAKRGAPALQARGSKRNGP
jgi:myo-inositol-1(or 4)-monophosphatase